MPAVPMGLIHCRTTQTSTRALGVSSSEWREGVQEFGAFAMLRHALSVGPFSR